jgi:starvation-inducible DNA-binding protein
MRDEAMKNNTATKVERPLGQSELGPEISREGIAEVSASLRHLLADVFALYVKTKNFHWHISGKHFRDYHLLLDDQAEQLFGMTDDIAERTRKVGGTTLRSVGDITKHQRVKDNDRDSLTPEEMLPELLSDNRELRRFMRATHELCESYNDLATASLIENWIDETERRTWFLSAVVGEQCPR